VRISSLGSSARRGVFTKTFGFADGLKRRDLCKGEISRAGLNRPALEKKGILKEARSAEEKKKKERRKKIDIEVNVP
jgi:hypothetical protein